VLLRCLNRFNLEQFEASRHKLESGQKVLVVRTVDALQMSVRMEYHVVRTNAKELN
jgi:hypothetical protein